MALYFVSYDLRKVRDHQKLFNALEALNAKRMLKSEWCLRHNNTTSVLIRDYHRPFIDSDDGLIVSEVTKWASVSVSATLNDL